MRLRKLEKQEHRETRKLYEAVFSEDGKGFVDYYYREKTKDNQIYVLEEDDGIRTMLHLNPYRICIGPRQETLHYIVAVATEKAYRKRGYMGMLLRKAMEDLHQAGESFTFLMPAAEGIYTPYGFRTVYEQDKKYLTDREATDGRVAQEADCRELAETVNVCLQERFQVYARRDEAYYRRLLSEYASDGGRLILFEEAGRMKDYGILLPEGEPIPQEKPKIMIRIIHLLHFLESLYPSRDVDFHLEVKDELITGNCGRIHLYGKQGEPLRAEKSAPEADGSGIAIEDLGEYLFGAGDRKRLETGLDPQAAEGLRSIVPLTRLFLNETV